MKLLPLLSAASLLASGCATEDARVCSKHADRLMLIQIRDTGPSYWVRVSRNFWSDTFQDDTVRVTFMGERPVRIVRKHPHD